MNISSLPYLFALLLCCAACTARQLPLQYGPPPQCPVKVDSLENTPSLIHWLVAGHTMPPAATVAPEQFAPMLKTAVRQGCDLEAPDMAGFTPLQAAVLFNDTAAAELLLSLGADPRRPFNGANPKLKGKNAPQLNEIFTQAEQRRGHPQNREALRRLLQPYAD